MSLKAIKAVLLLFFLIPVVTVAENSSFRSEVKIAGDIDSLESGEKIFLRVVTPEGLHRIILKRNKSEDIQQRINSAVVSEAKIEQKLFSGRVLKKRTRGNKIEGVAASLYEDILKIDFFGHRRHLLSVSVDLRTKHSRLSHAPRHTRASCSHETHSTDSPADLLKVAQLRLGSSVRSAQLIAGQGPVYQQEKVVEIATDADYEFFVEQGGSVSATNARMKEIINAVNSIYSSQIGLRFKIISQNVFTSNEQPYHSADASDLLGEFRNYTNQNRQIDGDVKHLFTGKNLSVLGSSGAVGLAYVGTICRREQVAYGLTDGRKINDRFLHLITAHELGHNFGATHSCESQVDSLNNGVMSSTLRIENALFSSCSVGQIVSHIDQYGECLETLPDFKLKFKQRTKRLKLSLSTSHPVNSCEVSIYASKKANRLRSSARRGTLIYQGDSFSMDIQLQRKLKLKSSQKIYLQAEMNCPGEGVQKTAIRSLKPGKQSRKQTGKLVSPGKFIKKLQRLFLSQ